MIVLALDTAFSAASAAVTDGDRVLAARTEPMERGHQERLAGLVREVMANADLPFDALDRIGVTVGPGSFTGLRVGLAFAKGLTVALGVPCVGIGALEALAASIPLQGLVAAAVDGRRGQIYMQLFREGARLTAPEALTLETADDRIAQTSAGAAITLIGSAALLLRPGAAISIDTRRHPDPVAIARLAAIASEPIPRPEPLYLRAPDAKTIAERAAR